MVCTNSATTSKTTVSCLTMMLRGSGRLSSNTSCVSAEYLSSAASKTPDNLVLSPKKSKSVRVLCSTPGARLPAERSISKVARNVRKKRGALAWDQEPRKACVPLIRPRRDRIMGSPILASLSEAGGNDPFLPMSGPLPPHSPVGRIVLNATHSSFYAHAWPIVRIVLPSRHPCVFNHLVVRAQIPYSLRIPIREAASQTGTHPTFASLCSWIQPQHLPSLFARICDRNLS